MTSSADVPLGVYASYVRRHLPLVVVCMVLGAVLGALTSHRVTSYVGTASVLVPPLDLGPRGVPGQSTTPLREKDAVTPDTEAQIATSAPVLAAVRSAAHASGGDTAVAKRITVDAPPNTQVLSISFSARRPAVAAAGAQAAATAFLTARGRLIADRQAADTASLTAQIAALQSDLADASANAAATGGSARVVAQLAETAIVDKIRSLQRTQASLANAQTAAGQVLRPAIATAVHPRLGREVPVTSGLLVGLLVGLGLGRLRPRSVLSARDLKRAGPLADAIEVFTVGPLAVAKHRRSKRRRPVVDVGLRRLRNTTVAAGSGVTLLTGPLRHQVAADVAAGFALSLARLGESVAMLVPANDRAMLKALHVSPSALRDPVADLVATSRPSAPGDVVTYGLTETADAASSAATLRRAYRHVLVIAPGEPDARACSLARAADRIVVTAERRRTLVRDVYDAIRRLRLVGATVSGALLVRTAR